jgi:hypothetical protein
MDDRRTWVSIPGRAKRFVLVSSPLRLDRLWSPTSLISSGYMDLFSTGWSSEGLKLTTHVCLVPRLWKGECVPSRIFWLIPLKTSSFPPLLETNLLILDFTIFCISGCYLLAHASSLRRASLIKRGTAFLFHQSARWLDIDSHES